MSGMIQEVREQLFALQDLEYRTFNCALLPTVDPETVIGVRTPALRKLARELVKRPDAMEYLRELPHAYFEENGIHTCIIESLGDYDQIIAELNRFLPYVDNWATCDSLSPKRLKKHLPELLREIQRWIHSEHTYTVRFGIGLLMNFYLDEAFQPEHLSWVAAVESREYYVNMMIAWYFATALAKQYEATIPYLEQQRMERWVHNKTIQKAVESRRISQEQKTYLKTLRIRREKTV